MLNLFEAQEQSWQEKWGISLLDRSQVFSQLPRAAYDELPGINSSLLKIIHERTEAHAHRKYIEPETKDEARDSLIQGNVCHCKLLEWDEFDKRYVQVPDLPKRPTESQLSEPEQFTKQGKVSKAYESWLECKSIENMWLEWEKNNLTGETEVITAKNYEKGLQYADALLAHDVLGSRYAQTSENRSLNEITFTYIDSVSKFRIKARIDSLRIFPDHLWIGDVKTAVDAGHGEDHFGRSIANFHYLLQAAFYHDAVYHCRTAIETLLELNPGTLLMLPMIFEWVAIEKAIPGPEFIGRYYATEEQLGVGRSMYRRSIEKAVSSYRLNYWPGYDTMAKPAELPAYYWRKISKYNK